MTYDIKQHTILSCVCTHIDFTYPVLAARSHGVVTLLQQVHNSSPALLQRSILCSRTAFSRRNHSPPSSPPALSFSSSREVSYSVPSCFQFDDVTHHFARGHVCTHTHTHTPKCIMRDARAQNGRADGDRAVRTCDRDRRRTRAATCEAPECYCLSFVIVRLFIVCFIVFMFSLITFV